MLIHWEVLMEHSGESFLIRAERCLVPCIRKVADRLLLDRLQTFEHDTASGFVEELVGFQEGCGMQNAITSRDGVC